MLKNAKQIILRLKKKKNATKLESYENMIVSVFLVTNEFCPI